MGLRRLLEVCLALAAATICVMAAIAFSRQHNLWPLPGLYLIEIVLAGLLGLAAVTTSTAASGGWSFIPWVSAGVLAAFVVLGAWTIGASLAPAVLALVLAAILVARRLKQDLKKKVATGAIAAALQATIILAVFLL